MWASEANGLGSNPTAMLFFFFLKVRPKNSKLHYFCIFTKLLNNLSNMG